MSKKKILPISKVIGEPERIWADDDNEDDETVFFHLQDKTHEFTMRLKDILKCLHFAEEKGFVPKLPYDWWNKISGHYIEFRTYNEPDDKENEE